MIISIGVLHSFIFSQCYLNFSMLTLIEIADLQRFMAFGQDIASPDLINNNSQVNDPCRVPTVREKSVKNEKSSRSGKSQGILILVSEI